MPEQATTTTDSAAASQPVTESATASELGGQPQQAEGQIAEGQKPEGDEKPAGAPEAYEFKAPEGHKFDEQVIEEYSAVAKELNLSQEAAQKMLDRLAPRMAERQVERVAEVRKEWAEASRADKEFGGAKYDENLGVANKAFEQFASPELQSLLKETGLTANPEVIRTFYRIGKAISEDVFVSGNGGNVVPEKSAQRLYSASNMNP